MWRRFPGNVPVKDWHWHMFYDHYVISNSVFGELRWSVINFGNRTRCSVFGTVNFGVIRWTSVNFGDRWAGGTGDRDILLSHRTGHTCSSFIITGDRWLHVSPPGTGPGVRCSVFSVRCSVRWASVFGELWWSVINFGNRNLFGMWHRFPGNVPKRLALVYVLWPLCYF